MAGKPDFKTLLKGKPTDFKKPPILPAGTYFGVIKSREFMEAKNEKKTPFVRYMIAPTSPGEDINPDDLYVEKDGQRVALDITKKSFRKDFFFTEDSAWRFTEFAKSIGLDVDQYQDTSTLVEDVVGRPCMFSLLAKPNQAGDELFNEIDKVQGVPQD